MKGYGKRRVPSKKDYFSFQLAQKKDIQNVLVLCYFWSTIFIWMLTFWYVCETFCLWFVFIPQMWTCRTAVKGNCGMIGLVIATVGGRCQEVASRDRLLTSCLWDKKQDPSKSTAFWSEAAMWEITEWERKCKQKKIYAF